MKQKSIFLFLFSSVSTFDRRSKLVKAERKAKKIEDYFLFPSNELVQHAVGGVSN